MADRPIIFSAPMVRALLAGRKTQTRRLLKLPRWASTDPDHIEFGGSGAPEVICRETGCLVALPLAYAVGDRLYVRERAHIDGAEASYAADQPAGLDLRGFGYRPSIHMPRWASRLTLTVIDVRIERLGHISEEDAAAEGFASGLMGDPMPETDIGGGWTVSSPGGWASAAGHFQILWSELHPEWDGFSSPWVVAIGFTVHRVNIDALDITARAP